MTEQFSIEDFEKMEFQDRYHDKKSKVLNATTHTKFKTSKDRKNDLDTVNKLIEEVVDKIRIWSGKHAELLQDLLLKKDQIKSANTK